MIKKILFICIGLISLFFVSIFISMFIDWKSNSMNGIFELKLGMSEEEMRELVDTTLLKDTISLFEDLDYEKILERKIKTLYLEYYIVDGIYQIEDIRLSFFENKLFSIEIRAYNHRTEYLLDEKYGKFKDEKEYFSDGDLRSEDKKWKTNDFNIECSSYRTFLGEETGYNLMIKDRTTSSRVYNQLEEYYQPKSKKNGRQQLIDRF